MTMFSTPEEILSIKSPVVLFGKDSKDAKNNYHNLLKSWHPDVNTHFLSSEVTSHINNLWVHYESGKEIPRVSRKHDIGKVSYFDESIEYEINESIAQYIPDIASLIKGIKYKDDKQKKEFSRYFPDASKIKQDKKKLVIPKPTDVISLQDALNFFKGSIDPKHVAWIINGVINNICLFHLSQGLSFNGITVENVFICPKHHTVLFLGGWWHITKLNEKPKILPKSLHSRGYKDCDMKSIYTLGLKLLGDENGTSLWRNSNIPIPMLSFLMGYSELRDPVVLFKKWEDVLIKCFGPRKFIEMNLNPEEYP